MKSILHLVIFCVDFMTVSVTMADFYLGAPQSVGLKARDLRGPSS